MARRVCHRHLEAIPNVLAASPRTAVVILTMHAEPEFAREALRSGARAYVLKEAADSELVGAARAALSGQSYLNPRLGARIAAQPAAVVLAADGLRDRELEVVKLLALGYTNTEIARQQTRAAHRRIASRAHPPQGPPQLASRIGRVRARARLA